MAVISGLAEWLNPDDPLQPSYAMPSWIAADLLGISRARVKQLLDAGILERGDCGSARRVGHGLGHQAGVTEVSVWRRMGIPFQAPTRSALVRQSKRRYWTIWDMRTERERLRHEQKRRAAGILPRSTPPPAMPTAKDAEWIKSILPDNAGPDGMSSAG